MRKKLKLSELVAQNKDVIQRMTDKDNQRIEHNHLELTKAKIIEGYIAQYK